MPTSINTVTNVPEQNLRDMIDGFRQLSKADIVTAINDGKGTFTVESTVFDKAPPANGSTIIIEGKMSTFGGPDDPGVKPDEGLSLFDTSEEADANQDIFLATQPAGTTGLAKRLNPDAKYLACRWNLAITPKSFLKRKDTLVTVTNPANKKSEKARPADTGPAMETGRVADLSRGLANALGLKTDQVCHVEIPTPAGAQPPPSTGVAPGVNFKAIDSAIFPKDMAHSLVVMTTSNEIVYWAINLIGENESGQSLLRRAGDKTDVVLSDTTVFPVKPSDQIPAAVADELNKAAPEFAPPGSGPNGPAPAPGADVNKLVLQAAVAANDKLDTSTVPGTKNGHLACAWAVNNVVKQALGKPIGGGLSTSEMFKVLSAHHTPLDPSQLVGGAVVISPTQGSNIGHVGIVGAVAQNPDNTMIFSNRSSEGMFSNFYTVATWRARYDQKLHLPIRFFTLNLQAL